MSEQRTCAVEAEARQAAVPMTLSSIRRANEVAEALEFLFSAVTNLRGKLVQQPELRGLVVGELLEALRQMCDCFGELDDVRVHRTITCSLGCNTCQTGMESNVNHKTSPSVGSGVGVPQPAEGEARKGHDDGREVAS